MEKALRIRKVLGGGMRQAGYLAAAGLYALENNRGRLKEDHRRAREIGEALESRDFIKHVAPIRLIGMGEGKLRLVTHLDYTEPMHDYVLATLREIQPARA
jgi:threonine aldolase